MPCIRRVHVILGEDANARRILDNFFFADLACRLRGLRKLEGEIMKEGKHLVATMFAVSRRQRLSPRNRS